MATTIVGLDIGNSCLKLAVKRGKRPIVPATVKLPENMVKDGRIQLSNTMADFLRGLRKERKLPRGATYALVLPDSTAICRRMTLPYMGKDQLVLNLPYEFKDYLTGEGDSYYFDYALDKIVADEDGRPVSMEIMAAAVLKSVVAEYRELFKLSGLRLRILLPQEMLWTSILQSYIRRDEDRAEHECCILDVGHRTTRVVIFKGDAFQASRSIDIGGCDIDEAISADQNVDLYVAQTYKESNYQDVLHAEGCMNTYSRLGIEVRKAITFYRFNNPESSLDDLYFSGASATIEALRAAVEEATGMQSHSIAELLEDKIAGLDIESTAQAAALAMVGREVLKNE